MKPINYTRATSLEQLQQVRMLQLQNSSNNISEKEKQNEGFVTVQHTAQLLEKMNNSCKHIIAMDHNLVIAYALVMLPSFKDEIPALEPLFKKIAICVSEEKNYLVMGQICIAKEYRKQGIFKSMYHYYKEQMQGEYQTLITEVATLNQRSLRAHLAIGFKIIHTYQERGLEWNIIQWDWN